MSLLSNTRLKAQSSTGAKALKAQSHLERSHGHFHYNKRDITLLQTLAVSSHKEIWGNNA